MQTAVIAEVEIASISSARVGSRLKTGPILIGALIARLIVAIVMLHNDPRNWFYKQATELGELARSILTGYGLASPFGGSTGPSAFLAPGYPALIACVFRFFGSYSTESAIAIIALQMLFALGTIYAMMVAARRLFGDRVANLTGWIWAFSLPLLWLPTIFWETSLSILLLTTIFALALRCAEEPEILGWLYLGLCSGIALLNNPSLAVAIAAVSIWAIWKAHKLPSFSLTGPGIAVIVALAVFLPWPIRNARTMHSFIPFRSNMGYELWQGNRPESTGFFDPRFHPNTNAVEFSRYASLGEVKYMKEKGSLAMAAIEADPARFGRLTVKRAVYFWAGISDRTPSFIAIGYVVLTTLLSMAGLWLLAKRRGFTAILPFLLPLLLFPLPYYLTHPEPRFRMVIDPIATMLTAYAVVSFMARGAALEH